MSQRTNKKFCMILTNKENQTFNAYRRIINSSMSKKNSSRISKDSENYSIQSVNTELKNSNFKSPFGRGEKRFIWQDNTNSNKNLNAIDLKGTELIKKRVKNGLDDFETFYDLSQELPMDRHRRTASVHSTKQRKIFENLNSSRVLDPSWDVKLLL
jgi:hypothetical protein